MECTVCRSNQVISLKELVNSYAKNSYTLYSCGDCQSRFFDVHQHPVDLAELYEQSAELFINGRAAGFNYSSYWNSEVRRVRKLHKTPINSVLDVGCRTGDFLLHWPKDMLRSGVELSKHLADIAVERGLDVRQGFLEEMDFPFGFDVVSAYAVIEHLAEPQSFLGKLSRVVNSNGILVIMIPSYQTLKPALLDTLQIRWHMYSPPEHLILYSREFLDHYLELQGFTLIKRRYTSGGMFNPFRSIPLVRQIFGRAMWLLDAYSPLNLLPIFDHMYSYYVKS